MDFGKKGGISMATEQNCIFCRIIRGELPSQKVYEDDKVLAFKDIQPVAPVHVLIVSKEHIRSVMELDASNAGVLADIHLAAREIARMLDIADDGFRLINNCGAGAGQTVQHLHYHLVGGRRLGPKIV